ncbi:unnamed protein product [Chrysoparadoxa australica]
MELDIARFDISAMCKRRLHFTGIFCGRRGSGKSTLMKDILHHLHQEGVPRVAIFSATEEANSFYSDFVPPLFVHKGLDIKRLERIVEHQKELKVRQQAGDIPAEQNISLVILLDDVAFDKKTLNSPVIRELFYNGRHHKITLLLTLQYLMDLNIGLRGNVDVAFFLKDNTKSNRARIHECFCGFIEKFTNFQAIFEACTSNFESLVVDSTANDVDISKNMFFYKADPDAAFRFGDPKLWEFNRLHYEDAVTRFQNTLERERRSSKRKDAGGIKIKLT